MSTIENCDILFIINPHSGSDRNKKIVQFLEDNHFSYFVTKTLADFERTMQEEIDKYKVFVAVGGDGTVNALAKCLIDREDKALAVLPSGSGNGFARELGFNLPITRLIQKIKKFERQRIDVLTLNDQIFFNVAGIGLDAAIATKFQRSTKRGFINYMLSTVTTYFKFKPFDATIIIGTTEHKGKFKLISIANTRQFGNNAYISPQSSPTDHQYELVLVKNIPLYLALSFAYKLFAGKLKNSKYIQYITVSGYAHIKTNCGVYHFDGDPRASDGNYSTTINEHFLHVIRTDEC